jgi:hypothetical protein
MFIRQLYDPESSTCMYLVAEVGDLGYTPVAALVPLASVGARASPSIST